MNTPPTFSPTHRPAKDLRASMGVELTHVRGLIQGVVRGILLRGLDEGAWKAFLLSLSPNAREAIQEEAGEFDWVSLPALSEAVGKHPDGRGRIVEVLEGSAYAELLMTDKHRWMLKVMTPELMISQVPRIYAFYHRGGAVTVDRIGPGAALVSLRAKGPSPAWFATLVPAWFKRSLELSGGKQVVVTHESANEDPLIHRYRFTWS